MIAISLVQTWLSSGRCPRVPLGDQLNLLGRPASGLRVFILFAIVSMVARNCYAQAHAGNLPLNSWVALQEKGDIPGYDYSPSVYVPTRGQLLQWGGVMARYRVKAVSRNDVRALDPARLEWVSDYPRAKDVPSPPRGHGVAPRGVTYYGTAEMLPCGTPWPSLVVSGVCYDSKRDLLIYTMKGLMAAYDVHAKKWFDMKARTIIYGKEYPGGPPCLRSRHLLRPGERRNPAFPTLGRQ